VKIQPQWVVSPGKQQQILRYKRFEKKIEPKLFVRLNRTGREKSDSGSLDEVMSMRNCLSGLSN
jgi:hypothetical protein